MTLEQFIHLFAFASNDLPEPTDAVLFIEADGTSRPEIASALYDAGFVKKVVITGETSRDPHLMRSRLPRAILAVQRAGVPREAILVEPKSISTREQATEFMNLAKRNGWGSITVAAPLFHQPRVYATFIQAMQEAKLTLRIVNYPVRDLSWFESSSHGTRIQLLKKELTKINRYTKKGHVASYKKVLDYQKWKEKQ